ncbi:hypothetical protein ACU686_21680 [Yinghuangia aomiensis]
MLDALSVGQEAVAIRLVHRIVAMAPIFCALGIVVIGASVAQALPTPHVRDHTVRQLVHPIKVIFIFCGVMAMGIPRLMCSHATRPGSNTSSSC